MLDARRLPTALVVATFALSGMVATTGTASIALGVGGGDDPICPGIEAERPARGILDCVGPSAAYVETATGSGSGLVLPDGYVLTNAHVVDPFSGVKVTLGEAVHEAVPVVGVDLFADIAVLGPVATDVPAVQLTDPVHLVEGDRLFLVGFPGEVTADDLKPTIADGILSRTRHSKVFDLHYLQTDASIGGGQSGGALVDGTGAVVGISSLRFAENFALAISAVDAQAAVDRILRGEGSPYQTWPGGEGVGTEHTVHIPDDVDEAFIAIPPAAEPRTIDVTVPVDLPVAMYTATFEDQEDLQAALNWKAIAAEEAGVPISAIGNLPLAEIREIFEEDTGVSLAEDVGPGSYRFDVPAGKHVYVGFETSRADGLDLPVVTSIPVGVVEPDAPVPVEIGSVVDGTVGSLVPYDTFTMAMSAGQAVEIFAGAPAGDMRVVVYDPDGKEADDFDDSEVGLYGVDVQEVFTAERDGTYTFEVGQISDSATGYRLEIRAPA